MPDATVARDVLVFAPRPQTVVFVIDGARVETNLYNFLDLPMQHALEVYALEDDMAATKGDFAALLKCSREIVRRLCPDLSADHVDRLVPSQMQAAIAASHGVDRDNPPRVAGVTVGAAGSHSADSVTPSPPAISGVPPS
jgi:hypothetical protein